MFNFPKSFPKQIGLILLALFYFAAGLNHFLNTDIYLAMMPPYLPAHLELVYLSGVLESLGGLGALFSQTRRWAGYGLIALTVVIFPANLYMAMNPDLFTDVAPAWVLYGRLPFQLLFIGWIYWATRPESPSPRVGA